MPRIPLSIRATYCPDWKLWEGVREIIQNAIDEQEFNGGRMIVEHLARSNKLIVTSEGVTLNHSVLLLGSSTKTGGERGHFGEGLKTGVLALLREGNEVTIYTGEEKWSPTIAATEQFAGEEVLVFDTRKLKKPREDLTIEIENISRPVWDALKKKFIFLSPPRAKDLIKVEGGTLLLHPDRKGQIYVKGIYVNDVADLSCGYDLDSFRLDRDRRLRLEDTWDLKYKLSQLWQTASEEHPAIAAERLYDMASTGKGDAEHLHYHADKKLVKAMHENLEKRHGQGVRPVRDEHDQKRLEAIGLKAVVVSKALHQVLTKDLPSIDDIVNQAGRGIKQDFAVSELIPAEKDGLAIAQLVLGTVFRIVEFNDGRPFVRWDNELDALCVARRALLNEPRELLRQLIGAEATRRIGNEIDVCLDLLLPRLAEKKAS